LFSPPAPRQIPNQTGGWEKPKKHPLFLFFLHGPLFFWWDLSQVFSLPVLFFICVPTPPLSSLIPGSTFPGFLFFSGAHNQLSLSTTGVTITTCGVFNTTPVLVLTLWLWVGSLALWFPFHSQPRSTGFGCFPGPPIFYFSFNPFFVGFEHKVGNLGKTCFP